MFPDKTVILKGYHLYINLRQFINLPFPINKEGVKDLLACGFLY